ncbi:hypothetical protein LCGC14_0370720 [marine sediment metagenome]|uniref:Uncharacterized protein n=1 Tax=marine sediment metagenome TaxID=412755 RepID=A0A0F9VSF3_9ZZZZ|nr:hypothetical protein [Maribacter sp.]HDZ04835.1 hypothetical protein [Maribacter sp.]
MIIIERLQTGGFKVTEKGNLFYSSNLWYYSYTKGGASIATISMSLQDGTKITTGAAAADWTIDGVSGFTTIDQVVAALDLINVGASKPRSTNYDLEVAIGLIPGVASLGIISNQADVGLTFADLWNGGGNLVFPTVAEEWEVVSSSVNDTIAGTGAQKIIIQTLAADYTQQAEVEVDMNGTTPVVISGTHFRKNRFVTSQVGSLGENDGDITLRVSGGGLVRSVMKAGDLSSFDSFFTVPLGKTAFWEQAVIFAPKGEDVRVRPRIQIGGVGPFAVGGISSNYQSNVIYPFKTFLKLPEKSEILFQARSDTNPNTFVTAVMEFKIINSSLVSEVSPAFNFLP